MNVLGICGSPHSDGNSAYALRHALAVVESHGISTTYISLAGKDIHPCDGCFCCKAGDCVYNDDMAPICEALRRCDGLILASPVYLGMVSGQMKVMMDRTLVIRVGDNFGLSGKIGAGIACGGARNGGQELTLQNMHTFFMQQDMLVIADGPRGSHSGATVCGNAAEDTIGLQTVANLANHLAEVVVKLRGRSAERPG
jgi:multimeric flavodoxin WrbA